MLVPVASTTAERVSYRMDASNQAGWWKPLAVHRGHVYIAYNGYRAGPRHTVWVARRKLSGGVWRRACLKLPGERRCVTYRDDIGHNQPTIAVDGRGLIHVFASMHHDRWRYFRSRRPGRVSTMTFRGTQLWPRDGRFTYPIATQAPNGDVWLIVRQSGIEPVTGRLYRWRVVTRRWYAMRSFAAAPGHGVYPDDLHASPDGRIHLLWSWSGGGAGGVKHAASYMVYHPRRRSYANVAGEPVAAPTTPDSPVVFQPLEEGESWTHVMDGYGQRGAKFALDPATGWPVIVYRYQAAADGSIEPVAEGAKVRLAEWNGSAWERRVVYEGATSEALGVTIHGGTPHVYHDGRIIYGGQAVIRVEGVDWPVAGGSLSVVQVGNVDYLYRAVPRNRALYFGARTLG